ncbi:MAG: hypothetical protein VB050_16500 [Geobacteraceae bacterium]|nr:hypothetical protein [Geobacteraceae bacterium]
MADENKPNREKPHRPSSMRLLDILFRTAHISFAGLLFGGFFFHVPFQQLHYVHGLTAVTGFGLLTLELCHSLNWPHQGRGVLGLIHILPLAYIHIRPDLAVPILWVVIVAGCVGSHLPKRFRHWSLLYGREVD